MKRILQRRANTANNHITQIHDDQYFALLAFLHSPYHYLVIFFGIHLKNLGHYITSSYKYVSVTELVSDKVKTSGIVFLSGHEKVLFVKKQKYVVFQLMMPLERKDQLPCCCCIWGVWSSASLVQDLGGGWEGGWKD